MSAKLKTVRFYYYSYLKKDLCILFELCFFTDQFLHFAFFKKTALTITGLAGPTVFEDIARDSHWNTLG